MVTPTIRQIQKAAPYGVRVWNDCDCGCYRAEAPSGYTLDGDLHEYLAPYWFGFGSVDPKDKRDARDDLSERLSGIELERCLDPDCDVCTDQGVAANYVREFLVWLSGDARGVFDTALSGDIRPTAQGVEGLVRLFLTHRLATGLARAAPGQ